MTVSNYRITFGGKDINYHDDFKSCRKYSFILQSIFHIFKVLDIQDCWYFFEPYVEITWIAPKEESQQAIYQIVKLLKKSGYQDFKVLTPKNGYFAGWYHKNAEEKEFEHKTYALSAKMAELFYKHEADIEKGRGLDGQLVRRFHVICNQMGINYKDEGRLCFWRTVLCYLFWFFGHYKAVWIYTKLLRRKY